MDDYKEEDYEDSNSTGDQWMDEEEMRREEEILRKLAPIGASDIEFISPDEGTPAYEALEANRAIKVTKYDKHVKRHIKRIKPKNFTRNRKTVKHPHQKIELKNDNVPGKVIDGLHELYTLTAGMMLGIRVAIGRQSPLASRDIAVGDFMQVSKIVFPPRGSPTTPPHQLAHTFKFKDYAPKVFRRLRNLFGIDSASYMLSVCGNYNFLEFIANSKSGQFFFYSHDGRFMIKTQTPEENTFMRRILPHYYRYCASNPHTHIVKIFGMHRVKMYHLRRKIYFVIMASVFDTYEKIHTIYDLKGSTVGRVTPPEECEEGVRKDLNLLQDGVKMKLGHKREAFLQQIRSDVDFLRDMNIMDYSLLLGIHDKTRREEDSFDEDRDPSELHHHSPDGEGHHHHLTLTKSDIPIRTKDFKGRIELEEDEHGNFVIYNPHHREPSLQGSEQKEEEGGAGGDRRGSRRMNGNSSNSFSTPPPIDTGANQPDQNQDDEDGGDDNNSNDDFLLSLPPHLRGAPSFVLDLDDASSSSSSPRGGLERQSDSEQSGRRGSRKDDEDEEEEAEEGGGGERRGRGGRKPIRSMSLVYINKPKNEEDASNGEEPDQILTHINKAGRRRGSHLVPLPHASDQDKEDHQDEEDDNNIHHHHHHLEDMDGQESSHMSTVSEPNSNNSGSSRPRTQSQRIRLNSRDSNAAMSMYMARISGDEFALTLPWSSRKDKGIVSREEDGRKGDEIYFVGIIDILQQYNSIKRIENFFKGFKYDRKEISAVNPTQYADRFYNFIAENTT